MPLSHDPASSYLTKDNILDPRAEGQHAVALTAILADAALARIEIAARLGVTSVTGGSIKVCKD